MNGLCVNWMAFGRSQIDSFVYSGKDKKNKETFKS